MILGIDANGRSFRWITAHPEHRGVKYSIAGIPPCFPEESFIWNNPGAMNPMEKCTPIPLERAWERLSYVRLHTERELDPLTWSYHQKMEKNSVAPGDAIARAIAQNAPVQRASEKIVLAIPNFLDETGQDDLITALCSQGMYNVSLLWRPIAIALAWAGEKGEKARELAEHDSPLWILDLESSGLELTRLRWRPHLKHKDWLCPVRDYPKARERHSQWTSYFLAREIAAGFCGNPESSESLVWGPFGSAFQRHIEERSNESILFQDANDPRRWFPSKPLPDDLPQRLGQQLADVICQVIKSKKIDIKEKDVVLIHGWPARFYPEAFKAQMSPPNAVAEGSVLFGKLLSAGLPTYYDTLPEYCVWAEYIKKDGNKDFRFHTIVKSSEVEAGDEWVASKKKDPDLQNLLKSFSLARHIHTFSLLVQNKTLFDDEKAAALPNDNIQLAKRLSASLPTMMKEKTPVVIDAVAKPASGHAIIKINTTERIFEDKNEIMLSWKTAKEEPEHKGYLEAHEVVGRIMDKPEYREMARLVSRKITFGPHTVGKQLALPFNQQTQSEGKPLSPNELRRLQELLCDYRSGTWDINDNHKLLERLLVPWGYTRDTATSQSQRGLWGSRMEQDNELLEIAREMGQALLRQGNEKNMDWWKYLNCMFVYTPKKFIEAVRDMMNCTLKTGSVAQIYNYNQIYAAGRIYSTADDFRLLMQFSMKATPQGIDKHWWSFFRCLCYHKNTVSVEPELAYQYLVKMRDYIQRHSLSNDERKYALHALLFALRFRELSEPNGSTPGKVFMSPEDSLLQSFNELLQPGNILSGERFPPSMLAGMTNMVEPGDNFSRFVWRFLNCKDTLKDRELGAGLATS